MEQKPIGEITHYYGHLGVAIIKFKKEVSIGDMIHFKGPHTDFTQKIDSMQFDHKDIKKTKNGQDVGIKVKEKVHESDKIFAV